MTDVTSTAGAINRRIKELGWSKAEVGRRAGMSFKTVDKVMENGIVPTRQDKRRELAVALGWPPDAIDRLDEGESPDDFSDSRPDVIEAILSDPLLDTSGRRAMIGLYRAITEAD